MPEAGQQAPDFTLTDSEGRKVKLADFAGRDVVLFFYPQDDTPGCTKEACGFRDSWDEIQALGAVVLGVSPDGAESHQQFTAKYRLPFRLLSDPTHEVMQAYGAYGEKNMYGKKSVGVIRSTTWIGPDGRVRKHWARVPDAAEHPARVLAALKGQS
jgi:peroxiredoxin Q/BCP